MGDACGSCLFFDPVESFGLVLVFGLQKKMVLAFDVYAAYL